MTNAEYEYKNQKDLKWLWYLQVTGRATEYPSVRRITCKGCERVYFTQVHCVKFCYECRFDNIGAKHVRRKTRLAKRENTVCKSCGNTFTPKRTGAVYCSNACRQKAYRSRVTDNVSPLNEDLQQP